MLEKKRQHTAPVGSVGKNQRLKKGETSSSRIGKMRKKRRVQWGSSVQQEKERCPGRRTCRKAINFRKKKEAEKKRAANKKGAEKTSMNLKGRGGKGAAFRHRKIY